MKIAISGGIGLEESLVERLCGHSILVLGSQYDLTKEKFLPVKRVPFIGEYPTRNYETILIEYDAYIEVSQSLKSKFLFSEMAARNGKKYFCLYYKESWKLGVFYSLKNPFSVWWKYEKPLPFFLLPSLPPAKAIEQIVNAVESKDESNYIVELESGQKIPFEEFVKEPAEDKEIFLSGQMDDVVSVSCGDKSVAISPMNEVVIDLDFYKEKLSGIFKITKASPFFLEFKVGHLSAMLFRQGRLIVKGTKEKNTAIFTYRNYIGN